MKKQQKLYFLKERQDSGNHVYVSLLAKILAGIFITLGAVGTIFSLGGFPVFAAPMVISAVAVSFVIGLWQLTHGKNYGMVLSIGAAGILFFLSSTRVVGGVYLWLDQLQTGINAMFGTFLEGFLLQGAGTGDVLSAGLVVGLIMAAIVGTLVCNKNTVVLTILTFSLLGANLLLGAPMPVWVGAVLFVGWLLAWVSCFAGFRLGHIGEALGVLAAVCLFAMVMSQSSQSWVDVSQKLKLTVMDEIQIIRYGQDSLPEGNLRKASGLLSGDTPRLEVEMSQPGNLYLRGYVGARYENASWQPLEPSAFRQTYKGMLTWLRERDFEPGLQYAAYQHADDYEEDGKDNSVEAISVSVKNVGASRKYLYLPEAATQVEGSGTWIQDWYLEADGFFGQKKYGFVYEPSAGSMDMVKPAAWVYQDGTDGQKAFLQAENVYRAFVRDQYLELSAEEGDLIHQAFFNGDGWEDTDQIYTITSRIRTVLRILASYTDTPKTVPAGQDFLKWFMQEGHEGNSAYFATAAVLAYRGAGIPARYVEGYLLTEEKAKAMEEQDGNTAVTLTGQDSHAWVEIYVDGMGWKSVEVTPGFYNGPHKADILVAVPNEALEGSNGQMAGIPSSEDYEMPDIEEDLHAEEAGGNRPLTVVTALLLILVGLLLFLENCRLLQTLIMMSKYKKMSYRQQFFHQYDGILACMVIMIPEFHDTQPLDIINKAEAIADFDVDLYVRTVERLERCIYGELEPGKQEVTTAEALNHNLKTLCKRKQPWYIRVIGRYKKIGCFQFLTHFIK